MKLRSGRRPIFGLSSQLATAIAAILPYFLQKGATSSICKEQNSCQACLQANPSCAWCDDEKLFSGARCDVRSSVHKECTSDKIVAPKNQPNTIENKALSDVIEIQPQRISLTIREQTSETLKLKIRKMPYPVDIHLQMAFSSDMTAAQATSSSLIKALDKELGNLDLDLRWGLGTFVDASPEKSGSYARYFPLSRTKPNPEMQLRGGKLPPDCCTQDQMVNAFMQAIVCDDKIGWRTKSIHLVIVATDVPVNFSDGKNGFGIAAFDEDNNEACYFQSTSAREVPTHFADIGQDSISARQVAQTTEDHKVNLVFMVPADRFSEYLHFCYLLTHSACSVIKLDNDWSTAAMMIKSQYLKSTQSIQLMDGPDIPNIKRTYWSSCSASLTTGTPQKTTECKNIQMGSEVEWQVNIELVGVPNTSAAFYRDLHIRPAGSNNTLIIQIETITGLKSCPPTAGRTLQSADCSTTHSVWLVLSAVGLVGMLVAVIVLGFKLWQKRGYIPVPTGGEGTNDVGMESIPGSQPEPRAVDGYGHLPKEPTNPHLRKQSNGGTDQHPNRA
ncbi:integrin beta-PS-like isoform X2 [Paramacrobiotus metropolitanus]|uniref:integrin beta-PS-like isoform X2 n=1 Tax=Paramacrobiotus metropolitanus TaxID=2943436 RepID=UPI002445F05A|nr:integrin beta-PS-like isoform X2 [Paramacrobiotus metropolitanus]